MPQSVHGSILICPTVPAQLWEALHEARQSCEHMTTRGVRAAKDVMVGWAGVVQDLTDRATLCEAQVMYGIVDIRHR